MNRVKQVINKLFTKPNLSDKRKTIAPGNRMTIAVTFTDLEQMFKNEVLKNSSTKKKFMKYLLSINQESYLLLYNDIQTYTTIRDPEERKEFIVALFDTYLTTNSVELHIDLERVRIIRARTMDDQYTCKSSCLGFLEKALVDKLMLLYCEYTSTDQYKQDSRGGIKRKLSCGWSS
jgi:hypothetical protein